MTRSIRLLSALAVLAIAAPASAQVSTHDHRKRRPPANRPNESVGIRLNVTSWAPQAGKPGTTITLEGSGFAKSMTVLFGGRPVAATITGTRITFRCPAVYGNGEIRLRKRQVADDYVVGSFAVEVDPAIASFSPARGPYGTRVEVRGTGFAKGDEIRMGGRAVPVSQWGDDRVIVTIPDWATTDYLVVSRGGYDKARSRRPFTVVMPAPTIADFSPAGGPPGTVVRLSGQNFAPTDRISYGRSDLAVVARGNGWVDVKIGDNERRGAYFTINGAGGRARSGRSFSLDLPADIRELRPTWGTPGSQLTLYGHNFRAGDVVMIGGQRANIIELRGNTITAVIPYHTASGDVWIARGQWTAHAPRPFDIVNPPTLASYAPVTGEPGSRVVLQGTWLAGAEVWYGATRLTPTRSDERSIEVVVPAGASDQPFRVRTRGGEATTQPFRVVIYGRVTDAKPRQVTPGSQLSIYGDDLGAVEHFYLGNLELAVSSRASGMVTVTVPANASTGRMSWLSHGRRTTSAWDIDVIFPPSVSSFAPAYGPAGSQVTLKGQYFDKRTEVYYGGRRLTVVGYPTPTQMVVQLPADVRGKDYFWVHGDGQKSRSASPYEVQEAPTVREVTPWNGQPGQHLTIRGSGFDGSTQIWLGSWRANILKSTPNVIYCEVPAEAQPGDYWVEARLGALTGQSRKRFAVDGWAAITGFGSDHVSYGATLEIRGERLAPSVKLYIAGTQLRVTKRDASGKRLWVTIPDSVSGEQWVDLVDGDRRSRSPGKLTIEPPPSVDVHDHRKDKDKDKDVDVHDHRKKKGRGHY